MLRTLLRCVVMIGCAAGTISAQTPSTFEAASVKVNTTRGRTTRRADPDRLTYLNITLGEFIQMAYDVKHYQIDGPGWVVDFGSMDRYDLIAKAGMPAPPGVLHAMLTPLLAERFHLAVHRETRVLPVYALVVARGGPKFKEGDGGETIVMPDGTGGMKFKNYPMAALAALLSALPTTGRPVLDRTGLTGHYTFTANLTDAPGGLSLADQKKGVGQSDTPAFTALQEQLGLKLDPERVPIEMVVVDRADRVPTEN